MKKQMLAVLGLLLFTCVSYAQPISSAEVAPIQKAALEAVKTLPQDYTFSALYQAVEDILTANAKTVLENTAKEGKNAPASLQSSEEFAITRLGEVILARRAYKKTIARNQELLLAFKKAGSALEKQSVRFDAANPHHIQLVSVQLAKIRQAAQKQQEERSQKMLKIWLQGMQNITDYGIKY